jgi:RimJ/RimL family protein N-acetyltransferase
MMIRRATPADAKDIWNWRNDPISIMNSLNRSTVSWGEHLLWFERVLQSPLDYVYIGYNEEAKIGTCRFKKDSLEPFFEVSINLNPEYRGRNLSAELLLRTINSFFCESHSPLVIRATIREFNQPSLNIFRKVGFKCLEKKEGVSTHELLVLHPIEIQ